MLLSQHELPGSFSGLQPLVSSLKHGSLPTLLPSRGLTLRACSQGWAQWQLSRRFRWCQPKRRAIPAQSTFCQSSATPRPSGLSSAALRSGLPLPVIAPTYTNLFSAGLRGCIVSQRDLSPNSHITILQVSFWKSIESLTLLSSYSFGWHHCTHSCGWKQARRDHHVSRGSVQAFLGSASQGYCNLNST